ncbi:hypothetical protein DFQ28_004293 [Apophysomyces sp. BC1034]|nr:hypothetical protein DFQ30_011121 [Apophysomyces sp. BC1015]KAG0176394.1 hypothetical protein DFQ29_006180 [Apophysomyces sp. BC1021]KAG0193626.1 hypothetical protein DFQ28_004293 [Apophysomyces sp. BC1034]
MTSVFSALSLKRNRSASTSRTPPPEPVSKLSKLKSGWAKLTSLGLRGQDDKSKRGWDQRRYSLSVFTHCFRSEENLQPPKPAFAGDDFFERNRYKKSSLSQTKLDLKKPRNEETNMNQNAQTVPAVCRTPAWSNPKKQPLPSILIRQQPSADEPVFTRHHRHTSSALSAPAFTQKRKSTSHIRHYSHVSYISSSNITVNSEDLTAKEFADIAGIKILSEDDDRSDEDRDDHKCCYCEDDDVAIRSTSSRSGLATPQRHDLVDEESQLSVKSYCSMHSHDTRSCARKPKIWDNDFWRKPGDDSLAPPNDTKQSIEKQRSRTSVNSQLPPLPSSSLEPPILHELRKMNTMSSEKLTNQDAQQLTVQSTCSRVIRKGRFEIHLEVTGGEQPEAPDQTVARSSEPQDVMEWKRKQKNTSVKPIYNRCA